MDKRLLTADDIAFELGIKKSAAYQIMHHSACPTICWGRRLYVRREDLEMWLLTQRKNLQEGGKD